MRSAQVDGKTRTDPTFPSGFMGARPPRAALHAPLRGARPDPLWAGLQLGLQMWCRSTKPMNTFGCCTTPRGGLRFTASRRRRLRYAQSRPPNIAGAAKLRRGGGGCSGCGWAANGSALPLVLVGSLGPGASSAFFYASFLVDAMMSDARARTL